MSDGAAIFETSGAWVDFSTLSQISVSLSAIDFKISRSGRGGRTARRCRGTRASGTSIAKCARIEACVTENLASPHRRPLLGPLRLSMSSIAPPIFEMSYNTNERSKLRCGAPAETDEGSTCKSGCVLAQPVNDNVPRVVPRADRGVEMERGGNGPNSRRRG
jgi:hypothetical protein